jgi:hypothetical protein
MSYRQQIDPDDALVALARRQHGNLTREQLLGLGLGKAAIAYRCRHKRLFRVHLGVYALGRPPQLPLERAAAAVLACGQGAALSHGSALSLWGFASEWRWPAHVTCPALRRRPRIVTHKAPGLTRRDIRIQLGIRVTSPARTLLDCAPSLPLKRLSRIAADARRSGHLHLDSLVDVLARFPYHPGRRKLLRVLNGLGTPTRSEMENAFLDFCRRYELPAPLVNSHVAGHEVDMLFGAERLIVELDGWEFHRDRQNFESDRDRDADTLAAGFVTVRITWERLICAPDREARRLHAILAARRGYPGRPPWRANPASGSGRAPA